MSFLNILVYDYTQKVQFDYFFAALILLLILLGFLLLKASKTPDMTRPKTSAITLIQLALMRTNPKKNRLFGRIALFMGVFLMAVYAYNFSLIKKPEWHYKINTVTGHIENVSSKTTKAGVETIITVTGKYFSLIKDEGHTSNRNLSANDSVTLRYYNDKNPRLNPEEIRRVVWLEVVE